MISNKTKDLKNVIGNLKSSNKSYLNTQKGQISHFLSVMRLMSPQNILNKGFAIIKVDNKIRSNSDKIKAGDELTIAFSETEVKTIVTAKTINNGREFDI